MPCKQLNGLWDAWTDLGEQDQFFLDEFERKPECELPVPGHWQLTPQLAKHQGSVFYRTRFNLSAEELGLVWRLSLRGAFYYTTIWINGQPLGQHEGYFQPLLWELQPSTLRAGENTLAIRVDCPPPGKSYRQTVLGAFGDWDAKPSWVNPGGIIGDVELIAGRDGFLREMTVDSRLTAWNAAQIKVKGELAWRGTSKQVRARLTVTPRNFTGKSVTQEYEIAAITGDVRFNLKFTLPDPKLWWTWDFGHPSLYDLEVLLIDDRDEIIDQYVSYLGIRTIKWDKWQLQLNGRRLFLRGSNYTPPSFYPATLTKQQSIQDADLMIAANLNSVRVHAHVASPDFYRACAEKGLLIWQDFPLDKRYDHQIMDTALVQIRQMVSLLASEPAIAFWACHNEPHVLPLEERGKRTGNSSFLSTTMRSSGLTWNKDILDSRLRAAVQQIDPLRPVFAHSGVFGFVRGGSDTHQYFGWNTGNYRTLQSLGRYFPQTLRLVSEYGAQSWPLDQELLDEVGKLGAWPDLPWEEIRTRYLLDYEQLHRHINPENYDSLEKYALATQEYQAELLQFYHETLRKRRFQPCAGAIMFSFADACPGVSWSMLDYRRQPKLAYEITRRAMRPVQVMVDWPKREFHAGESWASQIYVVNDLNRPMVAMGLTWQLLSQDGTVLASERRIADADRDQVTSVGQLRIDFPDEQLGRLRLELCLELPNRDRIENSYWLNVIP